MSKNNSFFKKFKNIFAKNGNANQCPYCKSTNLAIQKTVVSNSKNIHEKEFLLKCNNCNKVGVKKEAWYNPKNNKQTLTDIEVEIND